MPITSHESRTRYVMIIIKCTVYWVGHNLHMRKTLVVQITVVPMHINSNVLSGANKDLLRDLISYNKQTNNKAIKNDNNILTLIMHNVYNNK